MGIPLTALAINPPESPIKQLSGALAIKSELQHQQLGEIQLQEARTAQRGEQVLMEKFSANNGDMNKTYADAVASGEVPSEILNRFRTQSVAAQVQAATLKEEELKNHKTLLDMGLNEFESLKGITDENEFQTKLKASVARLLTAGADAQSVLPFAQSLAQNHTEAGFKSIETQMKGPTWVLENEKQQREALQAPTTAEVEQQRQATLAKTIADTNKAAADTSLALAHKAQLGEITAEDRFKEDQANYRALIQKQATFAQGLQKNGLEQLDKMFADPQHGYTQFISQAQATKNNIMQSRNGNELASNLEPLMLALGVTSYAGVHRINQTEVNAAGPQAGSLYRRLDSLISKSGSGSVPEDTLREASAIVDGLIDAKHSATINGANMVVANAGLDPKKTMVMDRSGVMTTLDKAAETNTRHQETPNVAVPANVAAALASVAAGRHTLSDGSVWDKDESGKIVKVTTP